MELEPGVEVEGLEVAEIDAALFSHREYFLSLSHIHMVYAATTGRHSPPHNV